MQSDGYVDEVLNCLSGNKWRRREHRHGHGRLYSAFLYQRQSSYSVMSSFTSLYQTEYESIGEGRFYEPRIRKVLS